MAEKTAGRIAVGICSEGDALRVAKIQKTHKTFKLLTVRSFELQRTPGSPELSDDLQDVSPDAGPSIEITDEDLTEELTETDLEADEGPSGDTHTYLEILNMAREKGARIALSVAEPQIFYNVFDSDWSLQGSKLLKRVNDEMEVIKEGFQPLRSDSIGLVPIAKIHLMAVIRERDISFLEQIERVKHVIMRRLPIISFTESVELSLINHVVDYHPSNEDAVTLILHIGDDYSRFIFLSGRGIFHISEIIGDGASSPDLKQILYRRLLLEMDTLELPQLDQVVISGKALSTGIKEYFAKKMSDDTSIEFPNFSDLNISALEPSEAENIGSYSVAVSIALRALTPEKKRPYGIDLTPTRVKESQKRLSISTTGWGLLLLMPLIVLYTFFRLSQFDTEINELKGNIYTRHLQEGLYVDLEASIEDAHSKLSVIEMSSTLIDSLTIGTETWSPFITNLMKQSKRIGGLWFTEISQEPDLVILKGFAVYRNRIPQLIKSLGTAKLRTVEEQEIREKTTYRFEIEIRAASETQATDE